VRIECSGDGASACLYVIAMINDTRHVRADSGHSRRAGPEILRRSGLQEGSKDLSHANVADRDAQARPDEPDGGTRGSESPSGNRPPTHPREILRKDFLEPLGLSQREFAERMGVSYVCFNELVNGRQGVTPDTALRLARVFGTT